MKEHNPCTESGCLGNCCKNINIELTLAERKRIFPDAIRVKSIKALKNVPVDYPEVYYTSVKRKKFRSEPIVEARIVGRCPHLLFSGNCDIHEYRSYAARNFTIGSKTCNEVRKENNLPIIFPNELVE